LLSVGKKKVKILHTADWHIGRHFHNVSLLSDQRHVLDQLINIIKEQNIEAVIIAGDIYDRSVPPAEAVELLNDTLHIIVHDLKVPVIMISGNHDGAVRLGFGARQLNQAGLHITGPLTDMIDPIQLSDAEGPICFYPIPYIDPATVRNVFDTDVQGFNEAMAFITGRIEAYHQEHHASCRSVVVAHCFIAGGEPSASERPLSVGGADQVDASLFKHFNYTALGHLHQPQFKGVEYIRYPGSLLKYSFSEVEKSKSVCLVDMDANGDCKITETALNPIRDMRVLEGELDAILAAGKTDARNQDYLLVRLLDKQAILDPMGKLRMVYPNVLHLEKPNLKGPTDSSVLDYAALQKNRLQFFEDFYQQVSGEDLPKEQRVHITELIDDIENKPEGISS
jgi:exonuclease SbcD